MTITMERINAKLAAVHHEAMETLNPELITALSGCVAEFNRIQSDIFRLNRKADILMRGIAPAKPSGAALACFQQPQPERKGDPPMAVFLTVPAVAGATFWIVNGIGQDNTEIPAQSDGSLKTEVDGLAPGDYKAMIQAGNVWGLSPVEEFDFTRPAALATPAGAALVDA